MLQNYSNRLGVLSFQRGASSVPPHNTPHFGKTPETPDSPPSAQLTPARLELRFKPLNQGLSNGCGTSSLAMALNYLSAIRDGKDPMTHQPYTQASLDPGTREMDSFVSPVLLQEAARKKGFFSEIYNDATFDEIRAQLAQGNLMLAVHKPFQYDDSALHYVVIHGLEDAADPQQRKLLVTCPAELNGQATSWVNFNEFSQKYWDNITWRQINTGMNRMMVAVSAKNTLPPSRNITVQVQVATLVNRAINMFSRLF